ncbi:hypothetical protein DERP_007437 [Dermatophagoides pteronyssinus]|uniref:MI domain-containing protein n=1 Tax=Dermatophagoides pteronyssinus TaxID=6956 RepID=A0ABQ8J4E8_DERPT|nr:hypothetical protein DERP_007437 [Dermatophagoides pteronyssinus]
MIVDCCAQQRTYIKFFGLLAQRFCQINNEFVEPFVEIFKNCYDTIHRFETCKLRNVGKIFAHLLYTDSIPWTVLNHIKLNENDTSSSSRVFIKILFQQLAESMGLVRLNQRIKDPTLDEAFKGLFPRDNPQYTRFAINFFTSIGLGGLTDDLHEESSDEDSDNHRSSKHKRKNQSKHNKRSSKHHHRNNDDDDERENHRKDDQQRRRRRTVEKQNSDKSSHRRSDSKSERHKKHRKDTRVDKHHLKEQNRNDNDDKDKDREDMINLKREHYRDELSPVNDDGGDDDYKKRSKIRKIPKIHQQKQPNILIVLADDLGWGDVSFHGSKQIPTPNIDLLASSGVMLNNYYITPLCSPSRSALLTGLNPIRTGMQVGVIAASQPYGLPLNHTTMGEHFQRLGYQTHLIGKWHQGFFRSEYLPTRRGFQSYFGYLTGHSDYFNRKSGQYATDMYTDRVVRIINEQNKPESKPWLIYMAEQSVHAAERGDEIQPPPRYENGFKYIKKNDRRRRFAGMVAALDDSIGRIFKALNDTNQLSNTIIVFSTDNGGAIGSITGNEHIDNSQGSNWPLKGGKYTLWEGGVRGTAFIWSPSGGNIKDLGDIDGLDQWNQLKNPNDSGDQNDNYKIRNHLLLNIDRTNHFFAVRYRNYKLKNGTQLVGHFDNWYEAPGQQTESPPEGIEYNQTTTFKILKELNLTTKPITYQVDCRKEQNPFIECKTKTNEFCLYDIDQDPCELTNLAKKRTDIVDKIYKNIFKYYDKQYVKPVNKPCDYRADPSLHGGFWKPWLD